LDGDQIATQTLFSYRASGMGTDGKLIGQFITHTATPLAYARAEYYGLGEPMLACFTATNVS
jgi:hypothetical protein